MSTITFRLDRDEDGWHNRSELTFHLEEWNLEFTDDGIEGRPQPIALVWRICIAVLFLGIAGYVGSWMLSSVRGMLGAQLPPAARPAAAPPGSLAGVSPWPLAVGQATRSESRPTQADIDEVQRLGEEIDAMSERLRKRLTPERLEELEQAEREQARQRAERDERRRAAAAKLDRAVTTLMWIGFPILLLFTLGFAWIGIWYGVLEIIHFPRDRISIAVNRGAELLIARPRLTKTLTVTRPLDQLSAITAGVCRLGSLRSSHAYHWVATLHSSAASGLPRIEFYIEAQFSEPTPHDARPLRFEQFLRHLRRLTGCPVHNL